MALRPWLLSRLIKNSGKLLHFDEEACPDWSCWTPSSLHPLGPPHPLIFCSYGLSPRPTSDCGRKGLSLSCCKRLSHILDKVFEIHMWRLHYCPRLQQPRRVAPCWGRGFLSQPASPLDCRRLPGTLGGGASGGPSQHPSHFPPRVCMQCSSVRAGKLLSFLLSFPRPSTD